MAKRNSQMRLKKGYKLVDTGRMHHGRKVIDGKVVKGAGEPLCKIYRLIPPEGKYIGAKLRQLRAERGVGNVRKIKKD